MWFMIRRIISSIRYGGSSLLPRIDMIAEFMVPSAYIPELSITLQWRKSRNLGEIELVFIIVPKLHVSDSYESRAQYSDPKSTCLMKKWHQFTTKVQ